MAKPEQEPRSLNFQTYIGLQVLLVLRLPWHSEPTFGPANYDLSYYTIMYADKLPSTTTMIIISFLLFSFHFYPFLLYIRFAVSAQILGIALSELSVSLIPFCSLQIYYLLMTFVLYMSVLPCLKRWLNFISIEINSMTFPLNIHWFLRKVFADLNRLLSVFFFFFCIFVPRK